MFLVNLIDERLKESRTGVGVSLQKLASCKAHTSRFISANLQCNKFKNRLVNIMPFESTRVCLQPIRGVEGSDYINASFIDGYRWARTDTKRLLRVKPNLLWLTALNYQLIFTISLLNSLFIVPVIRTKWSLVATCLLWSLDTDLLACGSCIFW